MASGTDLRRKRLTMFVTNAERETARKRAAAAGLSVGAYIRQRAVGADAELSDEAALHIVDALIDRMEVDLDSAIAALSAMSLR
jgi:hypothetical protein